jgi:hypothetical protein
MTTANDSPSRDPVSWKIWGSNDDSNVIGANFTLISEGGFVVNETRFSSQTVPFTNSVPYKMYRVIFPQVADPEDVISAMQVAEVGLLGYTN